MIQQPLAHTVINVRGVDIKLMTYTRSLELCARMNYETENLDFIDQIAENETLYDLGACEGRFSIYAAKKGIRVVSFEPEERNYKVFMQNIRLNNLETSQILAINAAVGSAEGEAVLNIGQPWEGGHQKVVQHPDVRNDLDFDFVETQTVNVISLDAFLKNDQHPFPDYLKIDIDGSELPFLNGARETLHSSKLKGIIFELNEQDIHFSKIISILETAGMLIAEKYPVPNEPGLYNIVFRR